MTPDEYTIKEYALGVSGGHKLYVHDWGNTHAKQTFLFLHGGPGGGCVDAYKAFFDGTRDHVIFFDQRGCGKSTPRGRIEHNTTQDLIGDIELILEKHSLKKVIVFGGSWGSTLALAYALAHPEHVAAMIIRGIFTSRQFEIDHLDKGIFRNFFPDVWDAYLARTPEQYRDDPTAYHNARAVGNDAKAAFESSYALGEFEGSVSSLEDRHKPADLKTFDPVPARIEAHYIQNHCFMEENHIMDNAHKLTMPVWIVQGRYDMVCPPITAYELHKRLPKSNLVLTQSGHSGNDHGNFDALRATVAALAVPHA